MQGKNIIIGLLVIIVLLLGYMAFFDNDDVTEETFVDRVILTFNEDYETNFAKAGRAAVARIHEENLRFAWSKNFPMLEKRFSDRYMILESDESVDFVALLRKEQNSAIFDTPVDQSFDFSTITTYSYRDMVKNGMAKAFGASVQPGDYLATVEPLPTADGLEAFIALYRSISGEWVAIGGNQ